MKRTLLRALLLTPAALALGCGNSSGVRQYHNNDVQLAVGHAARDTCSCLFVMGQDEAFCQAWVKASPDIAKVTIDRGAAKVHASALMLWEATAHYEGEPYGCVVE